LVNQSKPTIAIFGGSFDPPHKGHQAIVALAEKSLNIDQLIVLPAYLNPFKKSSSATPAQRLTWCKELFALPPRVIVDSYEIDQGESTPTSQSVKHFNQHYCVKYLIIGSDNLPTLTKWHQFEWLNHHITWVVITRENHPMRLEALRSYKILSLHHPISSTSIRTQHCYDEVDERIQASVEDIFKGVPHP
jgi:nicotinate-nucleotide adenylyltransferase